MVDVPRVHELRDRRATEAACMRAVRDVMHGEGFAHARHAGCQCVWAFCAGGQTARVALRGLWYAPDLGGAQGLKGLDKASALGPYMI